MATTPRGGLSFGSAIGAPEGQIGPRRNQIPGRILGAPDGTEVEQRCDDEPSADGTLQLLTVLDVGRKGAEVPRYYVDYSADGRKYTVEVPWQMVACGSRTPRGMCPRM
ncbi:hypothetical protein MU582_08420 [Nocardioidaceae bacterium SCSIO 66511]|nr:hypothetical protein MU582_08420 [Nocardioidaceae bacterium SCSIO 66511]